MAHRPGDRRRTADFVAGGSAARARLAVLLSADDDVALADNLTEVAISTLAARRDGDLVGTQELRGRLR